jgi:hypothetical protein
LVAASSQRQTFLAIIALQSITQKQVRVVEQFKGQIAWQGTVEVFDLVGHPKAKRAYARTYRDGNQNKTITVLHIPPVDSPETAIKVAVAAKVRQSK